MFIIDCNKSAFPCQFNSSDIHMYVKYQKVWEHFENFTVDHYRLHTTDNNSYKFAQP